MSGLKRGAQILILISGILETAIAFVAYWVFYAISKSNGSSMLTPMVILFSGMVGGILAIIGSVLIKSTKMGGAILSAVSAGLQFFATLFLILQMNGASFGDAVMIILPFFVIPNALTLSGGVIGFVSLFKNEEEKAA